MERKLGIQECCLPGVSGCDTLPLLKNAGFTTFFSGFGKKGYILRLKEKAEQVGIHYDFVHAPFVGINSFLQPGVGHLPLYHQIMDCITETAEADVNMIVMHVSSGWFPPELCDVALARFDAVVDHAVQKGVKVAFENLRMVGNLAYIMDRYAKVPEVGFCYDNGHEHCYTETVPFLELFGKRTICTHIHDNHGRDKNDPWGDPDIHILPFDGNCDFADMMARLNKYDYQGTLTLEVCKKAPYQDMSNEAWLSMCYERLKKISEM